MDKQCPTVVRVQDEATPSTSQPATSRRVASESAEARERGLARIRARRRECLASETAEEKESLIRRRAHDRAQACSPLDQRGTPRADAKPAQPPEAAGDRKHLRTGKCGPAQPPAATGS